MEDVFEVVPVLASPKFAVSSAAAFRSKVYAAAEDGSLRVYDTGDGKWHDEAHTGHALRL
jgi:hypothetical protein